MNEHRTGWDLVKAAAFLALWALVAVRPAS